VKPLETRFSNPGLDEVMRIVPFTLRITHYSRAPASWPGRPKIHVTGYSREDTPSGTTIESESESEGSQKQIYGTVEMTASGDVRWTIVRLHFPFFFCILEKKKEQKRQWDGN